MKSKLFFGLTELRNVNNAYAPSVVYILVDENTKRCCYPVIKDLLNGAVVMEIVSGEEHKSLRTCEFVWEQLSKQNADRKALLVNLGGGVIGDLGGFAASCYKRGIPFINIPTTLLAMVDAAVGGKTGIDFMGFKNQVGLFAEPWAVFVEPEFLKTLPDRELTSGFAEVIKHYLIADREAFVELLNTRPAIREMDFGKLVGRNISIKQQIVEQDPNERGVRKALNFGHTIGHALESLFLSEGRNRLLHGEAIAAGMICEGYIASKKNLLQPQELEQVTACMLRYFTTPVIDKSDYAEIIALCAQDKKTEGKNSRFSLLNGIGNFSLDNFVEENLILESLDYLNSRVKQ